MQQKFFKNYFSNKGKEALKVSNITVTESAFFNFIFLLLYYSFTMEGLTLISSFCFHNQLDGSRLYAEMYLSISGNAWQ